MQVTFLLGPAGSGKTHRCLTQIRDALKASPDGPPLLLLSPKQATFQLERQLLAHPDLAGYTRLQIVSFERLAEFVLSERGPTPAVLGEEGRVMALRALLTRLERERQLQVFHATARLPGFAQQVSLLLRELQQHQLTTETLSKTSRKKSLRPQLASKLADLAVLSHAYSQWLKDHQLQDASCLLDVATDLLRSRGAGISAEPGIAQPSFRLAGLWLDGFAEMTPQELALLAALLPHCDHATLAFCLDHEPEDRLPWLSTWSVVAQTFRECRSRVNALEGVTSRVEVLSRQSDQGRFVRSPALNHLERHWADAAPASGISDANQQLRLALCPTPESEAVLAAHEILQHVRAGGRFRDCAVLVRTLNGYCDSFQRVFTRYGIPFFLDRREPVAHHPLAELTRFALRVAGIGWKQEDWFGVLKTGLLPASDDDIDWLENMALEHGWEGAAWKGSLAIPGKESISARAERLRHRLVPPFIDLASHLADCQFKPTGTQLAEMIEDLWAALAVEERLAQWSESSIAAGHSTLHSTVRAQMQSWLENLKLAFSAEALPLREWLTIIEAGLSGLTVGVVPPALDQVLVGAIDRSRNPDLQLAIVAGLNEGVFPAPPAPSLLVTDADRDEMESLGIFLGPNRKSRLGHERYFGYIACTRSQRRLVLTCAAADADGKALNPSLFVDHLRQIFPDLEWEKFALPGIHPMPSWSEARHPCELAPSLVRIMRSTSLGQPAPLASLASLPPFVALLKRAAQIDPALGRGAVVGAPEKLFGSELATSVSALEDYAACPFKFFVARGLRAEERKLYEADEREQGTFQHEVLKEFLRRVCAQGRTWRLVSAVEACVMVRQIGEDLLLCFRDGLFQSTAAARFRAEILITQLEDLIAVLVGWAAQYEFEPAVAELDFGFEESPLPAWRLDLGHGHALLLRGRIDRVDLWTDDDRTEALAVIIDYKSSVRPLDATKLHHGLQLQLLSYAGVLRHLSNPRDFFRVNRVVPAGVFYVGLRSQASGSPATREEAAAAAAEARQAGYQHTGRFNSDLLRLFDSRPDAAAGDQFKYRLKKDGSLYANSPEALPSDAFNAVLDKVEEHLHRIGNEVFAGNAAVSPFRKGTEKACDRCDFRAVCRFDPWVEPYRVLRPPPKPVPAAAKPSAKSDVSNSPSRQP